MGKRILVLGGGVGGQVVANELRRGLPEGHRVTLIEKDTRHGSSSRGGSRPGECGAGHWDRRSSWGAGSMGSR